MALATSQENFDEIVKENIQMFEMSVQEAIDEAVQQLESQGASLGMIVKDASQYAPNGDKLEHPVVVALKALTESAEKEDEESITASVGYLKTIKDECDIDIPRRCFVGKNNAYPVLVKCIKVYKSKKDMLVKALDTMCSLCNSQPDLLDDDGVEVMMQILREHKEDSDIAELIVKLIRLNCVKHETNRRMYVKAGLIKELVKVLVAYKSSPNVVKEVAFGLRVLTLDDDIRVPFGSAHENAKQIVIEGDALRTLLLICGDFTDNINVQGELFTTLSKLVVRNEFCKEVMDLGGLDLILTSCQTNVDNKDIIRKGFGLLKALAGNDDIKKAIVEKGGIQLILDAMTRHQGNPQVASAGCMALTTIVLRQPDHCSVVMKNNGHQVILQAMKVHTTDEAVQKNACMAIRNIVARTREHCAPFLELHAEELISLARKYNSCEDEAKAALRDLGCQVDLKELWTGEKGSLPQANY